MKPTILIVLDGWGYREEIEDNAIAQANTPHWDHLWENYPHTLISASGKDVGLPEQQMGNSEVGHMHLGAGRIIHQSLTRINQAIDNGEYFKNPTITQCLTNAATNDKAIHILGLLSPGGIHSHDKHIKATIEMAAQHGVKKLYFHAFLDGRDTPPQSAQPPIEDIENTMKQQKLGTIASVIGRYYAMDRDQNWERTQLAYDLITQNEAPFQANSALEALKSAYARGENDEFVQPTLIKGAHPIEPGDSIIFINFRADRARQLSRAYVTKDFSEFTTAHPPLSHFITLTEYAADLKTEIAFPKETPKNSLGECIANQNLHQLRIAETEKYAHVTFFFNGGQETPFKGEERTLIPSPKVKTYDLQPQMSAALVTEHIIKAIEQQKYDLIICNFANPDMVGHTGNFEATIKAIETIDTCLEKITTALEQTNGQALITADHGNAELMRNHKTQQAHTAHTNLRVPLLFIGKDKKFNCKDNEATLVDIAPTILSIMNLPIPQEMTGKPLLSI